MIFDLEWEEAPGVRDKVLAATWGRLRLKLGTRPITQVIVRQSSTQRTTVYGSVFPLTEWLVENWWHLLNEPISSSPLMSGRAAKPFIRDWVQRHNLLAARDGGALPDLTIARDGEEIVLHWESDPELEGPSRLRFIGQGHERILPEILEDSMATLVERVLQRLHECLPANEEVERLAESWAAIRSSDSDERKLCESLAVLGLDPYDPQEASEAMLGLIEEVRSLPGDLALDLLSGSDALRLAPDLAWVQDGLSMVGQNGAKTPWLTIEPEANGLTAHDYGYQVARGLRSKCSINGVSDPMIEDLAGVFVEKLGWASSARTIASGETSLDGLVALDASHSAPTLLSPQERHEPAERFRLARAAFFPLTMSLGSGGRLLTNAATFPQRAARAFAAELLAPADVLAKRVGGLVTEQQVEDLASELKVAPTVIGHQIENHGLGYVGGY